MSAGAASALKDQARLEPLPFQDLAGWETDDHAAAFQAFLRSCRALDASAAELRPAQAPRGDLLAACREALKTPRPGRAEARRFFETHFQPVAVIPHSGNGFLTGYYEPEFQGSRTPDTTYRVPCSTGLRISSPSRREKPCPASKRGSKPPGAPRTATSPIPTAPPLRTEP
jgi:membrane-bound lytic murein transglycosylase A